MRRTCDGRRKDGTPCKGPAVRGSTKCRMHLGKRATAVRVEREARDALARLDVAPVDDPLTELAQITGQVVAWKDVVADRVNELNSIRYSTEGGEQLRAEVALFERALDRCEKFLTAMARLRIDERLAKVTEQQAELVANAVTAALADLGLEPQVREEARRGVVRHLRAVSGSGQARKAG